MLDIHFFWLDSDSEPLLPLLSVDERARAARFKFDRDRNRYIVCRGTLRELLGAKLGVVPASLEFAYGTFGKPRLRGSEVCFNVSHSCDMAMVAITDGVEVGCDIERIDPAFAGEEISQHFFSPYEIASLRALPVGAQCAAFFRCWTRKEAFIKACGMGVSLALDSFDVTLGPEQPAALLRGAEGWTLRSVDAPLGFAAAIVLKDQPGITMPTNSLMASITKSGGLAANVSG